MWEAIKYQLAFWNKKTAQEMSNPEIEGEINLDRAKEELNGFSSRVRDLVAQNMSVKRQKEAAHDDFVKLDSAAKTIAGKLKLVDAVANPQEAEKLTADLNQAAGYAVSAQQKEASLGKTISDNDITIAKLKKQISDVQETIANSQNKFEQLKARNTSAKIRTELAEAQNGLNTKNSAIGKLNEFEDAVEKIEDVANAQEDMNASTSAGTAERLVTEYGTDNKSAAVSSYLDSIK